MAGISSYYLPQFATTTLNTAGGLTDSQTTGIILTSVPSDIDITKPGILCVTYTNPLNTSNAEFIFYTSIDGTNELQGVTRAGEGFAAKTHSNGATVAWIVSKSHINAVMDAITGITTGMIINQGDLNGTKLILDADADTSITADTDDEIDFEIAGSDVYKFTATNIQKDGADPDRIIELPAASWTPTTTAGCADVATIEAGTNDIDYKVLDFDTSTDENAFLNFQMPESYDGGVIQFRFVWTNAGGGSAETVVFELSGIALADDGAIDQAVGTPIEVSDTWIAQGDIHISDWSGDVTLAGSPAGGQWVHLEIKRDVSEDDLTGDARLIGVQIKYKQDQFGE